LGKRAIVSKSMTLDALKKAVTETEELDVQSKGNLVIPAGAFVLFSTLERIRLSSRYAGHIGMRSYYTRKGLNVLSGLQIDPGFSGVLVLGAVNLSPRSIEIPYAEPICTIEIVRLNSEAAAAYCGTVMDAQKEGKIPAADRDYLRTIETMSVGDLTQSLITLSNNVSSLRNYIVYSWVTIVLTLVAVIISTVIK